MRADLLKLAADLAERGEPFALAIVVRREPASSSQAGDMALVTAAGEFHGWLGGTCTQPTVLREARQAIADGRPRLVALSPTPEKDHRPGVAVQRMTCHSGGTVDIYLEPVLPPPRLLVFGVAPAARALCRLGKGMGWAVDVIDPAADRTTFPEADRVLAEAPRRDAAPGPAASGHRLFAVVATMGQRDEEALAEAVALEPDYLGVIASRRRFEQIAETLTARGVPAAALRRAKNPAGLDIGAKGPEEIAVSILAEVVKARASLQPRAPPPAAARSESSRDPICGMSVEVAGARHVAEYGGRTWYFCRAGCREKFLAQPERWAAVEGAAP